MFISVIIPNYNHARFLKQRIDSVLLQDYDFFELILLDDASTDDSRKIMEEYRQHPKVKSILFNDKNSGSPFKQWVKGIQGAKGQWIWIAESDDYAEPNFLKTAAAEIQKHDHVALFYCDSLIENGNTPSLFSTKKNTDYNTNKWSHAYCKNGIDELNEALKFSSTINNASAMVFSKHHALPILKQLAKFRFYGDWFFYIHMAMNGNICYSPKALNHYRAHEASHLHSNDSTVAQHKEYFRILWLLLQQPSITYKDQLSRHFSYYYLGFGFIKNGFVNGASILLNYFSIHPILALKVTAHLVRMKTINRKTPQSIL